MKLRLELNLSAEVVGEHRQPLIGRGPLDAYASHKRSAHGVFDEAIHGQLPNCKG